MRLPVAVVFVGSRPSATEPPNAITNTAAAATIANTSTVSEIRADNRIPRIISVSASAPTTTATTVIVAAPLGHAETAEQGRKVIRRTDRARHRRGGVADDQRPARGDAGNGTKPLDRVAVEPTDRDHPGRELADAVPDRRHQQCRDDEHRQASTRPAAGMTSAGSVTITADGATADTDCPSTCTNDSCARRRPETGELLLIGRTQRILPRSTAFSSLNLADRQMRIYDQLPDRRSAPR